MSGPPPTLGAMTRDAADLVDRLAAALPAIALGVPATLDDTDLDQEISDELALALRISRRAPRAAAAQLSFAGGLDMLPRATIGLLSGTLGSYAGAVSSCC